MSYTTYQKMIDAGIIQEGEYQQITVEAKIRQAEKVVEAFTGRIFESRELVDWRSGGRDCYFFYNPVLEVGSISSSTLSLGSPLTDLYTFDNFFVIDKRFPLHSDDVYAIQFYDSLPNGHNNVKFELTVGLLENDETPELVEYLTGKLTYLYLNPEAADNDSVRGIRSERADDHSISYSRDYETLTGNDELDDIIKMYRRSRMEVIGGLA